MNNSITPHTPRAAGDRLVAELERLGLRYLSRGPLPEPNAPLAPVALITGLAASPETRLRVALVPLLLWQPDYASTVPAAADQLSGTARTMLQRCCCITAATRSPPDGARAPRCIFARPLRRTLDLPPTDDDDPAIRLAAVAACHAQLSSEAINWLGTYEHAADTFLRFAELLPG